jgi:hypothetical protein
MPGGHLSNRLGRTLILSESTYGTDAIDLANNLAVARTYMDFRSVNIAPKQTAVQTQRVRGSGSAEAYSLVKDGQTITIEGALTGAIAVGTTEYPHFADLLNAAGLSETLVPNTSATYAPSTTQQSSMTVYHWMRSVESYKWRMQYCTGVRGNMTFNFPLRSEATYTFTGEADNYPDTSDTANFNAGISDELAFFDTSGLIDLDKTGSAIVYTGSEAYADDPKMIVDNITITVDSQAFQCSSATFNLNRTVKLVEAITGTPTTAKVLSLYENPETVDFVLEESAAGFEKVLALMMSGSEVSATIVLSRGSGNDKITFTFPKLQVVTPTAQDSGGIKAWSVNCQCNGDYGSSILGDNSFTIVWSQAA